MKRPRSTFWLIFLGRRFAAALGAILGVMTLVFVVTRLLGDPARLILGPTASAEQIEAFRAANGYDDPIYIQFFHYLGNVLTGDLGVSSYTQQPVTEEIALRLPATLELAFFALVLGLLWTIPLGIISARKPGGIVDRISQAIVEFGVAIPNFFLGLLLILIFSATLGLTPAPVGRLDIGAFGPPEVTGWLTIDSLVAGDLGMFWSALEHLALPAITLALTACPPILQLTRNAMIAQLGSDHVRAARSLGLSQRTINWYAGKNALSPVLTLTSMTFAYLVGNAVLVEQVFSWPGIGQYAVQNMQRFDYAPVTGVALLASAVYVFIYFITDVISMLIDPRVREGAAT